MIDLTTYALLRKQITTAASGVSDVRAEGDELVFVLADGHEVRVAIPATEIRDAVVRDDVLVLTLEDNKEVVVDATLTQSGQAADAKVTGDVVSQLKGDLSDNANADAETRRNLDYLWKLNQGISYQFETDDSVAYSKTVPSGAKLASVISIGGHTEAIDGELVNADIESVVEHGKNLAVLQQGTIDIDGTKGGYLGYERDSTVRLRTNFIPVFTGVKYIATYLDGLTIANGIGYDQDMKPIDYSFYPNLKDNIFITDRDDIKYVRFILRHVDSIDITPDCRFQFEVGTTATQYAAYHKSTYCIPNAVLTLPGYGWSAGDVCNSIERTETGWQYVQRVGKYVFDGTENWIVNDVGYCYFTNKHFDNGLKIDNAKFLTNVEGEYRTIRVRADGNGLIAKYRDKNVTLTLDEVKSKFSSGKILHYEYETPIITDITGLMNGLLDAIPVEAGGTLTFGNAAKLPVSSSVEYVVKISEVNGL